MKVFIVSSPFATAWSMGMPASDGGHGFWSIFNEKWMMVRSRSWSSNRADSIRFAGAFLRAG